MTSLEAYFNYLPAANLETLAFICALILILDHGVQHVRHRIKEWKGRWFRWVAAVVLIAGLCGYVAYFCGIT